MRFVENFFGPKLKSLEVNEAFISLKNTDPVVLGDLRAKAKEIEYAQQDLISTPCDAHLSGLREDFSELLKVARIALSPVQPANTQGEATIEAAQAQLVSRLCNMEDGVMSETA